MPAEFLSRRRVIDCSSAARPHVDGGYLGERHVGQEIKLRLANRGDEVTRVLANCLIPAEGSVSRETDFIVIGPYGATVIEVKNWRGPVHFLGQGDCQNGARPMRDPRPDAEALAKKLYSFLCDQGLNRVRCAPLVLFANDEVRLDVRGPVGCNVRHLSSGLEEVLSGQTIRDYGLFSAEANLLSEELIERAKDAIWGGADGEDLASTMVGEYRIEAPLRSNYFQEYIARRIDPRGKERDRVRLQRHQFSYGSFRNDREYESELRRLEQNSEALKKLSWVRGVPSWRGFFVDSKDDGVVWTASEFVEATPLSDCGPAVPVLPAIRAAAETLAECHAAGVIHRALTPECMILRSSDRHPQILHFDFSRIVDSRSVTSRAGDGVRHLIYAAPEVRRNPHDVTCASDVYSLGLVALELLSRTSLRAQNDAELREEIEALAQQLSLSLRPVILAMCHFDPGPGCRIQTMREVAEKLRGT